MAEVALRGVEKRWGSFAAVRNLNLDVADRDFLVLLGPSGCGKTTTMRMIAGLETVTAGDILIDGQRVNDRPARDRDIAMVFQNYGLYPHLTVAGNIAYPLRLRRVPEPDRSRRVEAAAAKVHLDGLLERRPKQLSGGQRQRVALARAIVRSPNLFLMDEPLSNLDATLRVSMRAELKHLHHELQATVIYVTHDQIEAMTLATRVAVMNKGELVQLDSPETIYGDPATLFVAGFIGSPPINQIRGRISEGILHAGPSRLPGFPQTIAGEVVAAIRPDLVSLTGPSDGILSGRVFSVEYTGSAVQVTVATAGGLVTAMSGLAHRPRFDEEVGLRFPVERCFLFDASTENRLRF